MSTVYVLGAGASKAIRHDAPTVDELLSDLLTPPDRRRHLTEDDRTWAIESWERITEFVVDFYRYRLPETPTEPDTPPRLEDILSQLDLAIEEGRSLAAHYSVPTLRRLRDDLVAGMCGVLRERLDLRPQAPREREAGDRLLRRFLDCLGPDDCIISLNYDLVIDNALAKWIVDKPFDERAFGYAVDYGFPVRYALEKFSEIHQVVRYEPMEYRLIPRTERIVYPSIYKLHGSLNWVYCPSCQQLDVTGNNKGVLRYAFDVDLARTDQGPCCPDCGGRYTTLIITPTLLKTYKNGVLAEVWRRAEAAIVRADRLIFIGYSMADADAQLACMFTRAVFASRYRRRRYGEEAEGCQVRVVQRRPWRDNRGVSDRYRRLFGIEEHAYEAGGFEAFIRRLSDERPVPNAEA